MKLHLKKDLVFFDLEATGLNVVKDRIIQYAFIKEKADGSERVVKHGLVNPGPVLISQEAYAVHGISNDQVSKAPTFGQVADELWAFLDGADLAGYNSNRFDIPMLMEEFARVGKDFSLEHRNVIDVQVIFHRMEARTLYAAYERFCGKSLDQAHDALADVEATLQVLEAQLDEYAGKDLKTPDGIIPAPVINDMKALHDFTQNNSLLDVTRRLKYDPNGTVVFNFGKYIGRPVGKTVYEDKNYFHWIQEKEFSHQVKKLVRQLREQYAKSLKADPQ